MNHDDNIEIFGTKIEDYQSYLECINHHKQYICLRSRTKYIRPQITIHPLISDHLPYEDKVSYQISISNTFDENSDSLRLLIKKYCLKRPKTKWRDGRRGGKSVILHGRYILSRWQKHINEIAYNELWFKTTSRCFTSNEEHESAYRLNLGSKDILWDQQCCYLKSGMELQLLNMLKLYENYIENPMDRDAPWATQSQEDLTN